MLSPFFLNPNYTLACLVVSFVTGDAELACEEQQNTPFNTFKEN